MKDKANLLGLLGAGAATLWLSGQLLAAVDRLPLAPDALKAVGLGYYTWFFFRYVLFFAGRRDLERDLRVLGSSAAERGRVLGSGLHDMVAEVEPRAGSSGGWGTHMEPGRSLSATAALSCEMGYMATGHGQHAIAGVAAEQGLCPACVIAAAWPVTRCITPQYTCECLDPPLGA